MGGSGWVARGSERGKELRGPELCGGPLGRGSAGALERDWMGGIRLSARPDG